MPDLSGAVGLLEFFRSPAFVVLLPDMLVVIASITLICSIGVLITAVTADSVANTRHNTTGELRGAGFGKASLAQANRRNRRPSPLQATMATMQTRRHKI